MTARPGRARAAARTGRRRHLGASRLVGAPVPDWNGRLDAERGGSGPDGERGLPRGDGGPGAAGLPRHALGSVVVRGPGRPGGRRGAGQRADPASRRRGEASVRTRSLASAGDAWRHRWERARRPGLPPAVIDWPPYFRPAAFALAVAAVDALCWTGAPTRLLDDWADLPEWRPLLRAFVYRTATRGRYEAVSGQGVSGADYAGRCRSCLAAVLSREG